VTLAAILRPPPLPHEHGAWVMLGIAISFGWAVTPLPAPGAWLAVAGLLCLFLARYAVVPVAVRLTRGKTGPREFLTRRLGWGAAYVVAAAASIAAALVLTPEPARAAARVSAAAVLGPGLVHAGLALVGRDRTVWGELVGLAGLAAGGPLVAATGGRASGPEVAAPGLLALAYFASTLVFVRAYREHTGRERSAAAMSLGAHLAVGACLAAVSAAGWLPVPAALSFLVVAARAVWGAVAPAPDLRALGHRELAVAMAFVACGILGLRLDT